MNNSIRNVSVVSHWDPAKAKASVMVTPHYATPTTEVRGRFTGPHCPYATTVEVAYPLRPESGLPFMVGSFPRGLVLVRAIIPEPSLWEPECPFVYDGVVELWQDGQRCDQTQFHHALRRLQLKRRGLLLNGRPFTLRGLVKNTCSEEDANHYRQRGCNLLVADVAAGCANLWDQAERFGFFMIGRVASLDEETVQHIRLFLLGPDQTITFGWLFSQEMFENPEMWDKVLHSIPHVNKRSYGLEITRVPKQPLPQEVGFLACSTELLPLLSDLDVPKITLGQMPEPGATPPPGILGWVDQ